MPVGIVTGGLEEAGFEIQGGARPGGYPNTGNNRVSFRESALLEQIMVVMEGVLLRCARCARRAYHRWPPRVCINLRTIQLQALQTVKSTYQSTQSTHEYSQNTNCRGFGHSSVIPVAKGQFQICLPSPGASCVGDSGGCCDVVTGGVAELVTNGARCS